MMQAIAEDSLELLKRDRSKRTAHAVCLRAIPFCASSETLQTGVERLDTWLAISVNLNHRPLEQVVLVVLACFLTIESRVTSIDKLNERWLEITRDVVSPCATSILDEGYLRNARKVALCVLYKYMPLKYGSPLLKVRPRECACATREVLEELQRKEWAERARVRIVGRLVSSAMQNVLSRAREETKVQQRRAKKVRRKLIQSTELVEDRCTEYEKPTNASASVGVSTPSCTPSHPIAVAADECAVCLEALGSKRPLFTCGHARCCTECAAIVQDCPMCRLPVHVLMEIYV